MKFSRILKFKKKKKKKKFTSQKFSINQTAEAQCVNASRSRCHTRGFNKISFHGAELIKMLWSQSVLSSCLRPTST